MKLFIKTLFRLLQMKLDKSMTMGGGTAWLHRQPKEVEVRRVGSEEPETAQISGGNLPTRDEMTCLPFLQSLPYRFHLRSCRISAKRIDQRHKQEEQREREDMEFLILEAVNCEPATLRDQLRHKIPRHDDWEPWYDVDDLLDGLISRGFVCIVVEDELELTQAGMKALAKMLGGP